MKISVIIPCRDAAEHLAQTLGSLVEQTRPADEIIVADDCSTDDSAAIAASLGERVQVIRGRFGRASKARNYAGALATGDALLFLDANDVLGPEALFGLEEALGRQPEGVATIPWHLLALANGRWVRQPASLPRARRRQSFVEAWLDGRHFPPCSLLWSRAAFARVGGWSEEFGSDDFGDMALRAAVDGVVFTRARGGEAFHRRLPAEDSRQEGCFSDEGLTLRLRALEKVAAWLEERGELERYRGPLTAALERVGLDARTSVVADIRIRCAVLQAQVGMGFMDSARREAGKRFEAYGRRVWRSVRDAGRGLTGDRRDVPALIEVNCGLKAVRDQDARANAICPSSTLFHEAPQPAVPLVSVIVPTCDRASLACRAIRSALAQTYPNFEILVVDDASQDGTSHSVTALADSRIRYLRQPLRRGIAAARNRGLREARGEFIAFLEADDAWLPDKLAAQVEHLQGLPHSIGLVYSGSLIQSDSGRERAFAPSLRGKVFRSLLLENMKDACLSSVMIRRDVLRVVGFFDESIPAMEDHDYWIRVARFYQFEFIDRPLVRHNRSERESRVSMAPETDVGIREHLYRKFRTALEREGLAHGFLLESARRRLSGIKEVDRAGAFVLALQAAWAQPKDAECYRMACWAALPDWARGLLARSERRLRSKLATPS